jgi:hypothetical protein
MSGGRAQAHRDPGTRFSGSSAGVLHGREPELEVVEGLVDGVRDRGAVLLVRGEPGIGKSALLAAATAKATDHGMQVLSAVGVQSEARLPFGGLHQLLRPILGLAEGLHARQRAALLAVFGMSDEVAPELFMIGLATLELIGDTAASSPVLVILGTPSGSTIPAAPRWLLLLAGWRRRRS